MSNPGNRLTPIRLFFTLVVITSLLWSKEGPANEKPEIIEALLRSDYKAPWGADTLDSLIAATGWTEGILSSQLCKGGYKDVRYSRAGADGIDALRVRYSNELIEATVSQSVHSWVADVTVVSPEVLSTPSFDVAVYVKRFIKLPADQVDQYQKGVWRHIWFDDLQFEPLGKNTVRIWTLKTSISSNIYTSYDMKMNKFWFHPPSNAKPIDFKIIHN